VLTRQQWANVVEFAGAVDAELVTSFATGSATRDEKGMWTPDQARRFLARTESAGGKIAAAEFMNEPTYAAMGGAPKGYDAAAYGRDIAVFQRFLKQAAPSTIFLGPGSVGEQGRVALPTRMLHSEDLLAAAGPVFDAFSYHFYGAVSQRYPEIVAARIKRADRRPQGWDLDLSLVRHDLDAAAVAILGHQFPGLGVRLAAAAQPGADGQCDEVQSPHPVAAGSEALDNWPDGVQRLHPGHGKPGGGHRGRG
jgi:hypothetical protein